MRAPFRGRLRSARRTSWVPLLVLVFTGHVALGALVLPWVRGAAPRSTPRRPPVTESAVERLLFVEPLPRPPLSTADTPPGATRRRPVLTRQPTLLPLAPATSSAPAPNAAPDTAPRADLPTGTVVTDDPTELRGIRPRFGDRRLWAPAASRRLSEALVTPKSVIDEALTPVVDSVLGERRSAGLAVSDWTATDRRGRTWGLAPSGLRLGRVGLSIQPPELTDRERAQLAARADIARFRHMTPGDAGFDSLKADLRKRRDEARRKSVPPGTP